MKKCVFIILVIDFISLIIEKEKKEKKYVYIEQYDENINK